MASDLTDDEFTVLLIAERGESMMPIGRWEKPVQSLMQKGFLHQHDKFNNVITEKGREAVRTHDAKIDHDLLTVMNKAAIASKCEDPKMPSLIAEMTSFVNRWPYWDGWKRVRIAVTAAELEEYKKYIEAGGRDIFYQAVRGVPLLVEEAPTIPLILVEALK